MAFKLDGKTLPVDVAFTSNGINYPANWLRLTTLSEKQAIGISEEDDAPTYDERFYWGVGNAKDLAELKTKWVATQKKIAGSLLSPYDWYVVRKAEKSTAIPTAITTYRDGVRTACDTREKEIDACSDIAALVTLYGQTEVTKTEKNEAGQEVTYGTGVFNFNMTQYPKDPNS